VVPKRRGSTQSTQAEIRLRPLLGGVQRVFRDPGYARTGVVVRRVARWFMALPRFVRALWLLAALEFVLIVPRLVGS
jgi:hypothetical protein